MNPDGTLRGGGIRFDMVAAIGDHYIVLWKDERFSGQTFMKI